MNKCDIVACSENCTPCPPQLQQSHPTHVGEYALIIDEAALIHMPPGSAKRFCDYCSAVLVAVHEATVAISEAH